MLKLLEEGKITADEGAELIGALGQTAKRESPPTAAMTKGQKLLLVGLLPMILGFFLPWYSFNLGKEMARMTQKMSNWGNQMSHTMGAQTPTPSEHFQLHTGFSGTTRISGGDIAHGLGWFVLLLGIATAVLPFVKLNVSAQMQKLLLYAPLAVGAVIIVYLLTRDLRHVSIGLPLTAAGYIVEFVGCVSIARCRA